MEEVVWVVSDVHLGAEGSNNKEFAEFLEMAGTKSELKIRGSAKTLSHPTKLILLGDFLELWDPIDDEFKNTARHLFESLKALLEVADEIIYVTGNHDEALESYEAIYPIRNPGFIISRRHYPREAPRYIQVGNHRYFFLHGHQFDRLFLWLGSLSSIPTIMAALNSSLAGFFPPNGWLLPTFFFVMTSLHLLISWPPPSVLYLIGLLSLPKLFTFLQTHFWNHLGRFLTDKPKHIDIEELIERRYYDRKKDTITADVVLYGHTHVPEICTSKVAKSLGKTLINTGSWVKDKESTKKNTFVVISKEGTQLLQWDSKKKDFLLLDSFPKKV